MGKWAKYTRKYKKQWEDENWARSWLTANENFNPHTTNEAWCTVCKVAVRAHVTDLKKHGSSKRHEREMKILNPQQNKQETLNFVVNVSYEDKMRDIKLAIYIAMHSSIKSIDHLGEILTDLGKGSGLFFF